MQNGDRIYIGNVELIYEVTSTLSVLPTLPNYCSALVKSAYQTAYNQFTTNGQSHRSTIAYTLKQESSVWKLKTESTPTSILDNYCSALKQKDYRTAYSQFSRVQQAAQTESQFASNFRSNTVTDCSVSRSDDTAGTGSISYTLSNGSKAAADYVLVQENGAWKIESEKLL